MYRNRKTMYGTFHGHYGWRHGSMARAPFVRMYDDDVAQHGGHTAKQAGLSMQPSLSWLTTIFVKLKNVL